MRTVYILAVLWLLGCSGGSPGSDTLPGCRTTSISLADRAPNKNQSVDLTVNFARGDSTSPLTVHWVVKRPDGQTLKADRVDNAPFTIQTDAIGTYSVQAVASDGCGDSAPANTTFTVVNRLPVVAIVGGDASAYKHHSMRIYGRSGDPDGDPVTVQWSIVSMPDGGSGSFYPPDADVTLFTGDLEGDYTVQLVAHDGTDSSAPVQVQLTALDHAPGADAGHPLAGTPGKAVKVTGSGSDQDGDPLTFAWSLIGAPPGSSAVLQGTTDAGTSLTPDLEGNYTLQLVTRDTSMTSAPSQVVVTAYHPVSALPHDVVAAAYDPAHDRLVFLATEPANALFLYDPNTQLETQVALGGAPNCLAVSPDGNFAAVGLNGSVADVDLTNKVASSHPVTGNVLSIARSATKTYFVAMTANAYSLPISTLDPSTGTVATSSGSVPTSALLALHPSGTVLYGGASNTLFKATIGNNGNAQVAYAISGGCSPVWFVNGGAELITGCGARFGLTPGANTSSGDFQSLGTIPWPSAYGPMIGSLDQRDAGTEIVAIPSVYSGDPDRHTLVRVAGDLSVVSGTDAFPPLVVSQYPSPNHGRWVFQGPAGRRYEVLETDDMGGGYHGTFGVTVY